MSLSPDAVTPASFTDALARMQQLEAMVGQVSSPSGLFGSQAPATASGSATSFQQALAAAGTTGVSASGDSTGNAGLAALQVAESQVGVTEQPPGSNDGPQIAEYRTATQGAYAGAPWCAYFVSWCASQAGAPIGDQGQGLGSVSEITDWARSTGRLTQTPAPGRADPLRHRARGHRQVGERRRLADDGRGQRLERRARGDAVAVRGHRLRDAVNGV